MDKLNEMIVYKDAYQLILEVYAVAKHFPEHERFGLYSQFTRAAVSVAANLREGYRKQTSKERLHFYNTARCSAEECKLYSMLSLDLGYTNVSLEEKYDRVCKMIYGYCKAIKENSSSDN